MYGLFRNWLQNRESMESFQEIYGNVLVYKYQNTLQISFCSLLKFSFHEIRLIFSRNVLKNACLVFIQQLLVLQNTYQAQSVHSFEWLMFEVNAFIGYSRRTRLIPTNLSISRFKFVVQLLSQSIKCHSFVWTDVAVSSMSKYNSSKTCVPQFLKWVDALSCFLLSKEGATTVM